MPKDLEKRFRHKVFNMLLCRKKITEDLIDMMTARRHAGFKVYCGSRIQPGEKEAMENLARYIIRVSFSQERMTYIREKSKVLYRSKDGKKDNMFDALEWLVPPTARCSHVPNKGEQMVCYYGYYSNISRGKRKKQNQDELIPSILEPVEAPDFSGDESSKERRKKWARLIQKIYEADPLTCPKCTGAMKIISVIEDKEIINKDPQAPRIMGGKSPALTRSDWATKDPRIQHRLFRFPAPHLREPVESLKAERVALCRPRVSRGLRGGPPRLIFQIGRGVQGRGITI